MFGTALAEPALSLVEDAVSRRWIGGKDLPDALEQVAVAATVRSAGAKGKQVGDELFAVLQLIEANPSLRGALADHSRTAEDRSALLQGLLDGKTLPATAVLVGQAVTRERGTVERALQEFLDLAAAALEEGVATVTTARELSQDEQQRLATALGQQYGKDVQLHVVVDPTLIGGLRVEIGDDVIDGTVAQPARRGPPPARRLSTTDQRDDTGLNPLKGTRNMTELSIRPEEIRDALQKYVDDYKPSAAAKEEVGTVATAGDGIARVAGLPVGDGQRAAGVRGRHARHRAEPRHPRDRRRHPR